MKNTLISLDPRITRLGIIEVNQDNLVPKTAMDQFETYEAFWQKRENAKYEHAGPVHAPNLEMAFLFSKEQFSRRFTCTGMFVIPTHKIQSTMYGNDNENIYEQMVQGDSGSTSGDKRRFEIFHLKRRGQQHVHAGEVEAGSFEEALFMAKEVYGDQSPVVNIWIAEFSDFRFSEPGEKEYWDTLPLKKYREAIAYKVQGKIDDFKNAQALNK